MMSTSSRWLIPLAFVALGFTSQAAIANAVNCPGSAVTTDREFTVNTTPDSSCEFSAAGNPDNNAAFQTYLANNDYSPAG